MVGKGERHPVRKGEGEDEVSGVGRNSHAEKIDTQTERNKGRERGGKMQYPAVRL
jgi:hypothetical protein